MSDLINPTKAQFAAFRELPDQGPVHMLNLVRLRTQAAYEDGRQCSGVAAYRAYLRESDPPFERVGGRLRWVGRFEATVIGPEDERWDLVFVAEYPSPSAFTAMLRDPVYREAAKHRTAAVAVSRLMRLHPMEASGGLATLLPRA